jgi:hypothetical protein
MTFVAEVREEYREMLPAITHEDYTGRLQTVTAQQNPFLYELITKFSEVADHSVLLNTSFNVNGKPILSRLSDALEILQKTQLDAVYYKGRLVFRRGEEELYERQVISENIKPLDDATTVYMVAISTDIDEITMVHVPRIKEIMESQEHVIVVVAAEMQPLYQDLLGKTDIIYFPIGKNLLYYHEMIGKKAELPLEQMAFRKYVRLLWMKALMYKNYHRTQHHMFVSMDDLLGDDNFENRINLIVNLAKEDSKLIVTGAKYDGKFTSDDVKRLIGRRVDLEEFISPSFDLVWGNMEQIEWLSVQYESELLSLMRAGEIADDIDYGLLMFIKHDDRFMVC